MLWNMCKSLFNPVQPLSCHNRKSGCRKCFTLLASFYCDNRLKWWSNIKLSANNHNHVRRWGKIRQRINKRFKKIWLIKHFNGYDSHLWDLAEVLMAARESKHAENRIVQDCRITRSNCANRIRAISKCSRRHWRWWIYTHCFSFHGHFVIQMFSPQWSSLLTTGAGLTLSSGFLKEFLLSLKGRRLSLIHPSVEMKTWNPKQWWLCGNFSDTDNWPIIWAHISFLNKWALNDKRII